MPIGNVSFGRVVALTGKTRDISKVNKRIKSHVTNGSILSYNVTDRYKNQSTGALSAAVARGEEAYVFVTRGDVKKVKENQKGWNSINNILSNISQYIDLNETRVSKAINEIV